MISRGIFLLQRALAGATDEEIAHWLRRGFRTWVDHAGALTLERCLELPPASRLRLAIRDYWLVAAHDALVVAERNAALPSARLHEAATEFERRAWPAWRHLERPPSSASTLEACLFQARRAFPFPGTPRQVANIVARSVDWKRKGVFISNPLAKKPARTEDRGVYREKEPAQ